MSQSLLTKDARIFPCPSCGEMIYSDAEQCRFCSATIDRNAAMSGAELQGKVNTACNQAKLVRNAAAVMWIFLALSVVPFMPFGWGFRILFLVIPVWLIYWQVKFGKLETVDPDYKTAKRDRLIALLIWLPALALEVLVLAARLILVK